ncbi:MAG: nucleotidyltransferase domain-containing protein [Deltaproteobacteria bacterium]|jgi:predicted nucleotidyltransferase|nr:nucleotidyltransferase domain-containing protein [Deltaproteobacteria bacterium]
MEQIKEDKKTYLPVIVEKLKNIGIHKIILFGSLASGVVHVDSDVDLIVVTNDDYMPQSYKQKSEVYLKVSSALTEITGEIPIDLIVYTKPMYDRFNELGSLFSKEISQKGTVLYEADH